MSGSRMLSISMLPGQAEPFPVTADREHLESFICTNKKWTEIVAAAVDRCDSFGLFMFYGYLDIYGYSNIGEFKIWDLE